MSKSDSYLANISTFLFLIISLNIYTIIKSRFWKSLPEKQRYSSFYAKLIDIIWEKGGLNVIKEAEESSMSQIETSKSFPLSLRDLQAEKQYLFSTWKSSIVEV